jgi:mono/diheme cytochrome c family protein
MVCALAGGCEPASQQSPPQPSADSGAIVDPLIADGREAYTRYCVGCHGVNGDGNGDAARFMHPRPRDFQAARFKFSSTRAGRLPTDEDLRRTIVEGLKGSAMPPWNLLPDQTVTALIAYIKTFSPKWVERRPASPIPRVDDPYRAAEDKSEAIARGERVYHGFATCWTCHPSYLSTDQINGHLAAMENPTRDAFRPKLEESEVKPNEDGELIYPPDFRRDYVRAGTTVDDLYRSIAAGITGTAMPTWVDSMAYPSAHGGVLVETADIWAMAYYVQDLIRQRPARLADGEFVVRPRPVPILAPGARPQAIQVEPAAGSQEEFIEE